MSKHKCISRNYKSFEYGQIYSGDVLSDDGIPVFLIADIHKENWESIKDVNDIYFELRKIGLTSDQCCEVEDLFQKYFKNI